MYNSRNKIGTLCRVRLARKTNLERRSIENPTRQIKRSASFVIGRWNGSMPAYQGVVDSVLPLTGSANQTSRSCPFGLGLIVCKGQQCHPVQDWADRWCCAPKPWPGRSVCTDRALSPFSSQTTHPFQPQTYALAAVLTPSLPPPPPPPPPLSPTLPGKK